MNQLQSNTKYLKECYDEKLFGRTWDLLVTGSCCQLSSNVKQCHMVFAKIFIFHSCYRCQFHDEFHWAPCKSWLMKSAARRSENPPSRVFAASCRGSGTGFSESLVRSRQHLWKKMVGCIRLTFFFPSISADPSHLQGEHAREKVPLRPSGFRKRCWHFPLHTLHSTLHTLHSTLHTLHSTLLTLHSALHSTLYTLHSTLHTLHFTLYTLHSTLHTPHSTLYTPHSLLYTPHSTLDTFHSTLHTLHFTLHTPNSPLYTPRSTLYILHSTLYILHSTL